MYWRYKSPAFFWDMFKRLDLDSCLHCFCPLFIIIERSWNKSDFWAHYRAKLQAFWSRKENASQKGSLLGASWMHHAAVWDYESKRAGTEWLLPKGERGREEIGKFSVKNLQTGGGQTGENIPDENTHRILTVTIFFNLTSCHHLQRLFKFQVYRTWKKGKLSCYKR